MIGEAPRNLRYSAADGDKYRRLTEDNELSPFRRASFKDVFVYAAAYGYRNELREELERPQPNIPFSALTEEDLWILKALSIAKAGSLNALGDERAVYTLAEEYANGAIGRVYLDVFGGIAGEPYRRMAQDVVDEYDRL